MIGAALGKFVAADATRQIRVLCALMVALASVLGGCDDARTRPVTANPVQAAAPVTPRPILPFDEAVNAAAEEMFQSFRMDGDNNTGPLPFVIDPLIDGATGIQSTSTNYIQEKVLALARTKYTRFQPQPFTGSALDSKPLVLIGTLNTINRAAEMQGNRSSWWICVVLVDLKSRKVVARGVALARLAGVDITPLEYFKDSPAWSPDDATSTYVKNCQNSKVGDTVDPQYLAGLFASSLIAQAIEAYDRGDYQQALDLYRTADQMPGGKQLRLYVGLYLTNQKLGDRTAEDEAFGRLVGFGLAHKDLSVKFLFRPASTLLANDERTTELYNRWLTQIARATIARDVCLEVRGHTTPTGLPPVNLQLSVLRAEYIKDRLNLIEPELTRRIITNGVGSRENLVGTSKDDESDVLDRRVEFKVINTNCGQNIVPEQYNVY